MGTCQNIDVQFQPRLAMICDVSGMRSGEETHILRSPFGELVTASRLHSEFDIGRLYHTGSTGMVSIGLGVRQQIRRIAYISRCKAMSIPIVYELDDRSQSRMRPCRLTVCKVHQLV